MSSNVLIDGIKYVPVTEVENLQIQKIRQVLESQKYLSKSAIEEIINAFNISEESTKNDVPLKTTKSKKKLSSKTDRQFEYNSAHKTLFNISGVLSTGSILYKTRKSPAKWNICHAILIRENMNNDSTEGMTFNDVLKIEKKLKLSQNFVRKIMYNIEHGDLVNWINYWNTKFNQKPLKATKPVENNPQKRRESVLYG